MGNKNSGGANRGRRWMSNPDGTQSKMVTPEKIDQYLSQGWHFGHDTDTQKELSKKWYNNGQVNIVLQPGDEIPPGYKVGQIKPGFKFSNFNYRWYTNGIDQKFLSVDAGEVIPDGWWLGTSESYKNNMSTILKQKGNYHLNKKNYSDEYLDLYHDAVKLEEFCKENHSLSLEQLSERFGCSVGSVYSLLNINKLQPYFDWYNQRNQTSCLEHTVINYIKSLDNTIIIKQHDREILGGKEIDIFLPQYNIGIEVNGTYWHCISEAIDNHKDKYYHYNKSKAASEKGIRLIHLYQWEILDDKIKSLLCIALNKNKQRIYARQCQVRNISNQQAKPFNEANHLQGHRNAQVTLGLFYNDTLVQLMSFSRTKYNKNNRDDNDWEIIRGCPGSNNVVVGGVGKLFKYFIRHYNPEKVFSYCDFNKFDGVSYEAIGMKFIGYTGPDKTWLINWEPVKRNPRKYQELKNQSCGIMWGAGSKKYLWHNINE